MMMDSLGTRPGVIRKQLLFDSALGSLVLAEIQILLAAPT